jgi:4-hydroxy-tetrahydrodipicolinate reductase
MPLLRVAVLGASGRMGSETCRAVTAAPDMELVASIGSDGSVVDARDAGAQVVVDFTRPEVVLDNLVETLSLGMHSVVGTSGFGEERLDEVRGHLAEHPELGVVVAPNFAVGAALLMRFAREAAPHFESVEIVELHHPDKVDAPSGTAVHTAEAIAKARDGQQAPDATVHAQPGARGATVAGIPVHSVRLRGLVAHEEVLLGSAGEVLTIRHDSMNRSAFMPGVLLAVREVANRPGLTVGIDELLALSES